MNLSEFSIKTKLDFRYIFHTTHKHLTLTFLFHLPYCNTANLGGLYSLFVGFSALTFFEIIHHYTIRFYANYKNAVSKRRQIVSVQDKRRVNTMPKRQYYGITMTAINYPSGFITHE